MLVALRATTRTKNAIPTPNFAYYLFDVGYNCGKSNHGVNLKKEAQNKYLSNLLKVIGCFSTLLLTIFSPTPINSLDIDSDGELIAAIYRNTCVVVAKIDTQRDRLLNVLSKGKVNILQIYSLILSSLSYFIFITSTKLNV